ncbi:MAG: carbamoyl phosphate synthase small subunit [Clostridia bacterium]|nr:carbamoyl phosphate synthase small subunit [Clostridia bacterium]
MKKKVYLTLQNGAVFEGYRFGAEGEITGEMVVSTNMVGYVETLTDPSNFGQIVAQTFPLVGNYGVAEQDAESNQAWVSAFVVREYCEIPSNFRSEKSLDAYLKEQGVIGVYGVDTRELTRILREKGVMNARISQKKLSADEIAKLTEYSVKDALKAIAVKNSRTYGNDGANYTVALWNLGGKKSTVNTLVSLGCKVVEMPTDSTAEEILATGADGVMISDGPGDPKEWSEQIAEVQKLLGKKPVFGVGLGHQLVALALGADTKKMKFGHRGGNQPVKCLECGKVYISSQNHGYVVISETVTKGKIGYVNVNDNTCEGIEYEEQNAFTLQFAPESCFVGMEENPFYKKFFAMMEKEKKNA